LQTDSNEIVNPQRIVYGNIPAGYFNGSSPAETAPFDLDKFVFPDLPRNPPIPPRMLRRQERRIGDRLPAPLKSRRV
jgi:hypothetical protein